MDNYYGVIGLGNEFSVLSNEGNFIDALVNNGNIDRAVFTVSNTSIVFGTNNETYPDKEKKTQKCKICAVDFVSSAKFLGKASKMHPGISGKRSPLAAKAASCYNTPK